MLFLSFFNAVIPSLLFISMKCFMICLLDFFIKMSILAIAMAVHPGWLAVAGFTFVARIP